jgi:hypothetical protein
MSIRSRAALLAAALLLIALAAAPAAASHTVARGLADIGLAEASHDARVTAMNDYAQLRVRYLRLGLDWSRAEPAQGVYDETYLAAFDDIAGLAQQGGIKLMLTVASTPEWASDSSLWNIHPPGQADNGWKPCYPPAPGRNGHIDDFGAFARYLAGRFAVKFPGTVFAYECWNEPNLWVWLFPQERSPGDDFAVKRYQKMLKAFYAGIKAGDPTAQVIAGATAPIGQNKRFPPGTPYNRTTPQRFARALKALGGAAYFDAYSHHPYTPGGSFNTAPEAQPSVPSTTVQLRNLGTLLDLFPKKDFYLTELGYNTRYSAMFGGLPLSQATQADYLRRAYRYAGRYSQVKALFWYLRCDDAVGQVYTGLQVDDRRKRSWYTFARGNRLTLEAPSSVRRSQTATLRGVLTSSRLGTPVTGLADKNLTLQRCFSGHWRSLKTVTTGNSGAFRCSVRPTRSGRYRVVWIGVATSPDRWITVK